jgi:chromosome segregation ATPase
LRRSSLQIEHHSAGKDAAFMSNTSLETIQALLEAQRRESKASWDGMQRENRARFDALDARLKAIDEKQAIANGRTRKLEESLVRMDERLEQLQRVDEQHEERMAEFDRKILPALEEAAFGRHRRKTDPDNHAVTQHARHDDDKTALQALIEKQAVKYSFVLAAGGGLLKFLEWFVREVLK